MQDAQVESGCIIGLAAHRHAQDDQAGPRCTIGLAAYRHLQDAQIEPRCIIGLAAYRHVQDAQIAEAACLGVVALFPERRFPPCVSVVVVSAMGMMSPTWKWRPLGSTAQVLGSVLGFIGKPFQGWYFRLGDAALDLYFQT